MNTALQIAFAGRYGKLAWCSQTHNGTQLVMKSHNFFMIPKDGQYVCFLFITNFGWQKSAITCISNPCGGIAKNRKSQNHKIFFKVVNL